MKRFSFVLFIRHCKTVIKADQKSCFYPSDNDTYILYQKYLKKKQCHFRQRYRSVHCIPKVLPVSSLAPLISGLQRLVVYNNFFASYPSTTKCKARFSQQLNSESSQKRICLVVILMHLFNFLEGLYRRIISILDTILF